MTPTSKALRDNLKEIYDKFDELDPSKDPSIQLRDTVAAFLNYSFQSGHYSQLVSTITWLTITSKYPSIAGWLMESVDRPVLALVEELCDAINEVYLEIR